ncbi:hypothetical protein LJC18_04770, partial [Lachnospiraceae bacterium OttesenSCG-928-E19]|nr:hypothetical protein [Lachnospiraceae bacterium OttesenSCG-928-E19]
MNSKESKEKNNKKIAVIGIVLFLVLMSALFLFWCNMPKNNSGFKRSKVTVMDKQNDHTVQKTMEA